MVSRIPNDIFQFSTLSALGAGLNVSGPPAAHLTGYGSHGIGTFAEPNPGDMVFLDAVPYLLTAEGVARRAPPDALLPFVMVTKFSPEYSAAVPAGSGLTKEDLMKVFASAGPDAGGKNSFVPFRVSGRFKSVVLQETQRALSSVTGTMFGFSGPVWAAGMSVSGVRCHFVSEQGEGGQMSGGNVKDFEAEGEVKVDWAVTGRYHLGFPRGEQWEGLDLVGSGSGNGNVPAKDEL